LNLSAFISFPFPPCGVRLGGHPGGNQARCAHLLSNFPRLLTEVCKVSPDEHTSAFSAPGRLLLFDSTVEGWRYRNTFMAEWPPRRRRSQHSIRALALILSGRARACARDRLLRSLISLCVFVPASRLCCTV